MRACLVRTGRTGSKLPSPFPWTPVIPIGTPPLSYRRSSTARSFRSRGVIAVIAQDTELLVIRRSQQVRAPGAYCFPGGGIERGESEEEALVRELFEELTATVSPVKRLYENATPSGVQLAWWLATLAPNSLLIPNPREVASVHWLSTPQIRYLPGLLVTNHDFLDAFERLEFSLDSA